MLKIYLTTFNFFRNVAFSRVAYPARAVLSAPSFGPAPKSSSKKPLESPTVSLLGPSLDPVREYIKNISIVWCRYRQHNTHRHSKRQTRVVNSDRVLFNERF